MTRTAAIPHSRPTVVAGLEEAVLAVVRSGQHAGGTVRERFERELAARTGVAHGIAVQSGSAALHLALLGLGVDSGDRVLIPSYVCATLLNVIAAVGGHPLVADVDPASGNLTAMTAQAALAREGLPAEAVRAAIVPHMYGNPVDLPAWELPIPLVEDAAMGLGARLGDRQAGSLTTVGIFSFYATKMLSTGQGGMVMTDDTQLAEDLRDRLQYDNRRAWRPSWNYPMPDLAAALGRAQLPHLEAFLDRRRQLACQYREALADGQVQLPVTLPEAHPNHFRWVVLAADREQRDQHQRRLAAEGVESKPPVFCPLHRYLQLDPRDFPGSESSIQDRALSLPIYPSLTDSEQEQVLAPLLTLA